MNEPPADRCGHTYPQDDQDKEYDRYASCCWRQTYDKEGIEKCLWHTESDSVKKTHEKLREARIPPGQADQITPLCNPDSNEIRELLDGVSVSGVEFYDDFNCERTFLREANFSGADISCANLSHAYLKNADLSNAVCDKADFHQAGLNNTDMSDGSFNLADLSGAVFYDPDKLTQSADMRDISLIKADLTGANLQHTDITGGELRKSDFSNSVLRNATLSETDLEAAKLCDADLTDADLDVSNINNANLSNANLFKADLSKAYLEDSNLSEAHARKATFSAAMLKNTDFNGSNIKNADFSSLDGQDSYSNESHVVSDEIKMGIVEGLEPRRVTDLSYADLSRSNAKKVDFTGANLENAKLSDTDLSNAILSDVNAEHAVFIRTNMFGSDLTNMGSHGATFTDVQINGDTTIRRKDLRSKEAKWWQKYFLFPPKRCRYDPVIYNDPGESQANRLGKAADTYQTLEKLARENAQPTLQGEMFILRQDMQRKRHWKNKEYTKWGFARVSRAIFKYGESLARIAVSALVIIGAYGFVYSQFNLITDTSGSFVNNLIDATYFSTLTFTTLGLGDFQPDPASQIARALVTSQAALGAIIIAIFVFVLGRRAAK